MHTKMQIFYAQTPPVLGMPGAGAGALECEMARVKSRESPALTGAGKIRFWSRVDKSSGQGPGGECWEWTGGKDKDGYGLFRIGRTSYRAHRVSFRIANSLISAGLNVLHTCDNPGCVNPDHLWIGTQADNVRDRDRKGRAAIGERNGAYTKPGRVPRGERHGCAKLTAIQICAIREKYKAGNIAQHELAKEYGISQTQIGSITRHETWKHITKSEAAS